MIVYVVTQGSYSDYHVVGVTLDKSKAEKIAKISSNQYDNAQIEEYDTDKWETIGNNDDLYLIKYVKAYGGITSIEKRNDDYFIDDALNKVVDKNRHDADYMTYVLADSYEKALKIGADRIAEFMAEEEGIS